MSITRLITASTVAALTGLALSAQPAAAARLSRNAELKLDHALRTRAQAARGKSRVIITSSDSACVERLIRSVGGLRGRKLAILRAQVAEISDARLNQAADFACPNVKFYDDRKAVGMMERTPAVIGAQAVWAETGFNGAGVGVAVIDSGVTNWHDDLSLNGASQRVTNFVDFVNALPQPYDDYGHGTHVAGIVAGNGYDSAGGRSGVAPGASIIALKVLDGQGNGYISNVIAAIDYAVAHKDDFNIRVINLSVGSAIHESYNTDPVTLAAKRAVDAGIVVVAAAGNLGRNAKGQFQYGSITAPGNAPWVLTVGASSHRGTAQRSDDTMAGFSSHGPTYLDYGAKPDLVAPGVGIESLSDPTSLFYTQDAQYLLPGTVPTSSLPYLSLSGTSMASPVVAGTVALMLQANPALTPNAVKAILQYTAEAKSDYDSLTQGAGFLNARGAVRLATYFAAPIYTAEFPLHDTIAGEDIPWSRHIIWGNYRIGDGIITPDANAWAQGLTWGATTSATGTNIVWGSRLSDDIVRVGIGKDNIVWGSGLAAKSVWASSVADDIVGGSGRDNVVWGSDCAGLNCDNVVWGSSGPDNVVWGSSILDNVVWGSSVLDNVVWGSSLDSSDVWGGPDNIVWGSSLDNIVWGSGLDNIVWGSGL